MRPRRHAADAHRRLHGGPRGRAARRGRPATGRCRPGTATSDDSSHQALVRRWLDALLHIDDTPERTAAAFALGVFFGFSPFLGLHTLLAHRLRVPAQPEPRRGAARRLLEPAVVHRALLRARHDVVGAPTHRAPASRRVSASRLGELFELSLFQGDFWHELAWILRPLLWPYTVGSLMGAVVLAAVAYPLALAFRDQPHGALKHLIHSSD